MPTTLVLAGVAQVGSNIYLFGGKDRDDGEIFYDTVYKFNTETETLTTLTTKLPQAMFATTTTQIGSNIYLFGGVTFNGTPTAFTTIYKFNVENETISALTTTLPSAIIDMGVVQIGSNIYLFGGLEENVNTALIYKFNAETETISTLSTIISSTQSISNMGVAQVSNNVYLFGGLNNNVGETFDTIYKFNIETETISTLTESLLTPLANMSYGQVGGNVYLIGGQALGEDTTAIYKFSVNF